MRLWHQNLIPYLDREHLLGQHRELCALRGKGWDRKHSTVAYVFKHAPECLVAYHYLVMDEMEKRGYHPDPLWRNPNYRGKVIGNDDWISFDFDTRSWMRNRGIIYQEHDAAYWNECLDNLRSKGYEEIVKKAIANF